MDLFIATPSAVGAGVEDSGWAPTDTRRESATGVMIGSGIGGLPGTPEMALHPA